MKQTLKTCIPGMSAEEYHKHPHLGSTTICRARRSWAHARVPFESTKAMQFGSSFHALIGEPKLFKELYVACPKGMIRNETHAKYKEFLAANPGKTVLTQDEWDGLNGMLESVLNNGLALRLLTGGVAESSYFWTDAETGVGLKCRPDYYRANDAIVDLKTAEDAGEYAFVKSLTDYGRHIQTAVYLDGLTAVTGREHRVFVHLVIEKKPPYAIAIYSLDDMSIDQGRREYRKLLGQYAYLEKVGEWPAYPEEVKAVSLPDWAFRYE